MKGRAACCFLCASAVFAQGGQQGPQSGWPCVPGRAVDPGYVEISEATGGQLFLFQKGEMAHAAPLMSAPYTHPATVMRAIGRLSGSRVFEFPVDSTIESLLVTASIQCRAAIAVLRPNGAEMTGANSAQSIDLQAGRLLRVHGPEPGKWRVRLSGTGLFVVTAQAQTAIRISQVQFLDLRDQPVLRPRPGIRHTVVVNVSYALSGIALQLIDAEGSRLAETDPPRGEAGSPLRVDLAPPTMPFRIRLAGFDAMGWPVERVHPALFQPAAVDIPANSPR